MSLFAKHDNLSAIISIPYRNISFSGAYAVLNLNSNINIKNTTIGKSHPSFIINNGIVNIIDTKFEEPILGDIVIDNSKHYIDDLLFNKFKYNYIEKGSIFKYSNVSYTNYNEFFNTNSDISLLVIPITCSYFKGKEQYVEDNHIENFGTGNQYYSTHFLNNGNYGYWGNKFGGEWTSDFNITLTDPQVCNLFLKTIPRNLNGHLLTIKYSNSYLNELKLNDFYNGTININFTNSISNNSNKTTLFNLLNNNLTINLKFYLNVQNIWFALNDNKDINIFFNKEINNLTLRGTNNFIHAEIKQNILDSVNIFNNYSYGNNVIISVSPPNRNTNLIPSLTNNQAKYGNFITVLDYDQKITDLVNDKTEIIDWLISNFMNFTIDEVHPKKYRDVSDIGTIVGWNAKLPIPRGYYVCNGQTVRVDLHNPQDEFYNGQLAYYLNGNLTTPFIQLPDIPSAAPSCIVSDPYYHYDEVNGNNFIPVDINAGIVYIIKYNNNFENKKKGM